MMDDTPSESGSHKPDNKMVRSGIVVYILLIYLTLPLMRTVLNFIYSSVGRDTLVYAVDATLIIVSVTLAISLIKRKNIATLFKVLIPILITMVFVFQLERPEERVHFLEYGVLGFFVLKTCDKEFSVRHLLAAILFVSVVGAIDEFIQMLLPSRVGDMRDVYMNAVGGALGVWAGKFWYFSY